MKVLILGGTRFFGKYTVSALLEAGHDVTVATRGLTPDSFGDSIERRIYDRNDRNSVKSLLSDCYYDAVIDKIAYSSNDVINVLDFAKCGKYVLMSTSAVYEPLHVNTLEEDFDPRNRELILCNRADFDYSEVKRQAECALVQRYGGVNSVYVRYPVVLGEDDYTKRLLFYIEHILSKSPMYVDNIDCKMSFIFSDEAGEFVAKLADTNISGTVNGASDGNISLREIFGYVEEKTGKTAILSENGDPAPYNVTPEFTVNTEKARSTGFVFSNLRDRIFPLVDYYIDHFGCAK